MLRTGRARCSALCQLLISRRAAATAAAVKEKRRIETLLVANRGEISCRVQRSAQRLGMQTVAVYSEVDANCMHVNMADRAVCIGPAASTESYLHIERILRAAKDTNTDAIHPGYGFLSESVEFAEECARQGIIFVGPPASAIRDMGIKSTSKKIMSDAGVPIIEGYHGEDQSAETLLNEAKRIGFPVMLKAVRGGGGKGMRISHSEVDFFQQLESAKLEALKSFADDVMLVEKFVERPRHVEVQVFGDTLDNYVYLFERDCSIQRRHQKVLEEAPAPGITDEVRRSIGEAAVRAARAVDYVGAGTVEFIMDENQKFYFMEMNTRLQVEHPVTEMITGQDLVDWQLAVAAGAPLPLRQEELRLQGHALEARLYAEDPSNNFLPGAGHLQHLAFPKSRGVRVDTGVRQGDDVTVHYDPMIAKLVVWAPDRTAALTRMQRALRETRIVGPSTNLGFLTRLVAHPSVVSNELHTGFIEQHQDSLLAPEPASSEVQALAAVLAASQDTGSIGSGAWTDCCSLRVNHLAARRVSFKAPADLQPRVTCVGPGHYSVQLAADEQPLELHLNYDAVTSHGADGDHVQMTVTCQGQRQVYHALRNGAELHVHQPATGCLYRFELEEPKFREASLGAAAQAGATAPMPGVVDRVLVEAGQQVEAGEPLLVMIAMKMEYVVRASSPSSVQAVLHSAGDTVQKGKLLVQLQPLDEV